MLDNKGFDLWADGYERSVGLSDEDNTYPFAGYRKVLASIYDTVRTGQGKRVLDIGFGTGVLACRLYSDGYDITGIDFSNRMIEIAREKMPSVRLIRHDFSEGLPAHLKDEKFDAIICTYAIHHLDDAAKISFLKELQLHLNPCGRIYIGDVAFATHQELEECRAQCGDEWDEEEFYVVAEEIAREIPGVYFQKMSHCAGILSVRNMTCRMMAESDIERVIPLYMDHYNTHEGGAWTHEITYKRIHQVWSREASMCLILEQDGEAIGFAMGYFEQFDDIQAYDLVEILIAHEHQGSGIGTRFMELLETWVKERGGAMIQLDAVNDDMHNHFYGKLGYRDCNTLVFKSKWL